MGGGGGPKVSRKRGPPKPLFRQPTGETEEGKKIGKKERKGVNKGGQPKLGCSQKGRKRRTPKSEGGRDQLAEQKMGTDASEEQSIGRGKKGGGVDP